MAKGNRYREYRKPEGCAMHEPKTLRYSVISDTGEPDAFKRCMSGSEGGTRKRAAMYLAGCLPNRAESVPIPRKW